VTQEGSKGKARRRCPNSYKEHRKEGGNKEEGCQKSHWKSEVIDTNLDLESKS
jgi:hypothetical protein